MPNRIQKVVAQIRPIVEDFDGNDAMSKDPLSLKQQIQQFANACLPEALRVSYQIMQRSPSNKDRIQAAKFIKSVADGQAIKQKTINGMVKKLTNQELNTALQVNDDE